MYCLTGCYSVYSCQANFTPPKQKNESLLFMKLNIRQAQLVSVTRYNILLCLLKSAFLTVANTPLCSVRINLWRQRTERAEIVTYIIIKLGGGSDSSLLETFFEKISKITCLLLK